MRHKQLLFLPKRATRTSTCIKASRVMLNIFPYLYTCNVSDFQLISVSVPHRRYIANLILLALDLYAVRGDTAFQYYY